MSSFELETDITSPYYGDIKFENNNILLTDGLNAIRQHIEIRFQIFLGEWRFDLDVGVPWFRDILIKNPSFVVVQDILKGVILDTPGVLELIEFNFDFTSSERSISLSFKALTQEGFLDYSQIVDVGGA